MSSLYRHRRDRITRLLPKTPLIIAFVFFAGCSSGTTVSSDDLISSGELGAGTVLEDELLDQYISGLTTGPCGGTVAWNAESPVGSSFQTEIDGQPAIVVHLVTVTEDAPAVVAALASDLGDGCTPEVELVGDPGKIETIVTKLDPGALGGTAWTIEIDASGAPSHGASHYVAGGNEKLSALQISSFEPLSDGEVLRIFALAVEKVVEGD